MESDARALRDGEAFYVKRLDDIDGRFRELAREMGMFERANAITENVRVAIAAKFARVKMRIEKDLEVERERAERRPTPTRRDMRTNTRGGDDILLNFDCDGKLSGRNVLKKWIVDHFDAPWPSNAEKRALAKQSGLSLSQVSNFFINARVRLWRPLVMSLSEELDDEGNRRFETWEKKRKRRA